MASFRWHEFKRDKAWDVVPYPCIGQFRFLNLSLYKQPSYKSVVERIGQGAKYLDVGCCLGQDLRRLVADGVPSENTYGAELEAPFIDLGYQFFNDRDTLKTHFMQANIMDLTDDGPLHALIGKIDFLHLGMVVHIFPLDKQRTLLENCVQLLKPEPGVLILGQAAGDSEGLQYRDGGFKHSDITFRQLWAEVSEKTGIKFECRASIDEGLGIGQGLRSWDIPTARRLVFEVERLE